MSQDNFDKNNYIIAKNCVSKELSDFCYNYLLLKKQVMTTLYETGNLIPNIHYLGTFEDHQAPNTYSTYGDVAMETLLDKIKPTMEKLTKYKLYSMYAYARVYKKGDILKRHKDRMSCEISTTLNLGGDPWPIYLEPSGKLNKKGVEVNLSPGDMLIYKGCEVEHWRNKFKGDICGQVFLHYRDARIAKNNYDNRPHLGLPHLNFNVQRT